MQEPTFASSTLMDDWRAQPLSHAHLHYKGPLMQDADICIIRSGIMGESDFWIACPLTDFDSMHYYESVQPIIYHKPLPPQHLPFPNHPIPMPTHTHCHLCPNMTSNMTTIPWQPPPPHATTLAEWMHQQRPCFTCCYHHLRNNQTPQSFLPTTITPCAPSPGQMIQPAAPPIQQHPPPSHAYHLGLTNAQVTPPRHPYPPPPHTPFPGRTITPAASLLQPPLAALTTITSDGCSIPAPSHGLTDSTIRTSHYPCHPSRTSGLQNGGSIQGPDYFEYKYYFIILYTYFQAHIYSLLNIQVLFITISTTYHHSTLLSIYLITIH